MTGKLAFIDSDVLIGILRKEPIPFEHAQAYLSIHGSFNISCITWYECYRGYKVLGAVNRLKEFQELMTISNIHFLSESLLTRTAEIYANLHQRGKLTGEFDLLIGTTALQNSWSLATNNEKHYQVLSDGFGLEIENWMAI